jgi:hypothetical protein
VLAEGSTIAKRRDSAREGLRDCRNRRRPAASDRGADAFQTAPSERQQQRAEPRKRRPHVVRGGHAADRTRALAFGRIRSWAAAQIELDTGERYVAVAVVRSGTDRTIPFEECDRPAAGTAAWPRRATLSLDDGRANSGGARLASAAATPSGCSSLAAAARPLVPAQLSSSPRRFDGCSVFAHSDSWRRATPRLRHHLLASQTTLLGGGIVSITAESNAAVRWSGLRQFPAPGSPSKRPV